MRYLQNFTYSATALDTYLKCPLQFYYSFVLRISRKDEVSGEIESADIGKLIHCILSEFFTRRTGVPLQERDLDIHDIERFSHKLFEQSYGKNVTGTVYLLKKQIVNHMIDFLKSYYIPLVRKETVTVLGTEYAINYRIGPHALKGRLDSIEKRGKKIYIIDYKTSANPQSLKINYKYLDIKKRESWNDAIGSLQLPFYILLYSRTTYTKIRNLNGMFLFLGKARISSDIEFPLFDNQAHTENTYGLLQDIILRILDEITDPSIPFTPSRNKREVCPSCHFQYICGTQWIVKRYGVKNR
jgi:CRISPR/Cas system-associated exonuclease Cas4 (RecB family)